MYRADAGRPPAQPIRQPIVSRRCRTAQPRRRRTAAGRAVRRHQARPLDQPTQQWRRIDVRLARGAARSTARCADATDHRSRRHASTRRQLAAARPPYVARSPSRVVDDHVADAGDDAAERDHPGRRRRTTACPAARRTEARGCRGTTCTAVRGTDRPPVRRPAGAGTLAADGGASAGTSEWHGHRRAAIDRTWGATPIRRVRGRRARQPAKAGDQATPAAVRRARRWSTDFVWSCGHPALAHARAPG